MMSVKKMLGSILAPVLKEHSFRRKDVAFDRKCDIRTDHFWLAVRTYPGDVCIRVTISLGIRFEQVEGMVGNPLTSTMGISLSKLVGKEIAWVLCEEEETRKAGAEILEYFHSRALPYFEKYGSLENAFEILRRDDDEAEKHCGIRVKRALGAVAIASLICDQTQQSEVIAAKREFLRVNNETEIERFEAFVSSLKS